MANAQISYGPKLGLLNNAAIGEVYYDQFRPMLRGVDALVQPTALSATVLTPPGSPADGDTYVIAGIGAGAWTGKDNYIAVWSAQATATGTDTLVPAWDYYIPFAGWLVWVDDLISYLRFDGANWVTFPPSASVVGQIHALSVYTADPPISPATGDTYILDAINNGGTLTGAWVGHDHEIAVWSGSAWEYTSPLQGYLAWVDDMTEYMYWDATSSFWLDGPLVKDPSLATQTIKIPSGQMLYLGAHNSSTGGVELNAYTVTENANGASGSWNVNLNNPSYSINFYNSNGELLVDAASIALSANQVQFTGTIEWQCARVHTTPYTIANFVSGDSILTFDATSAPIIVNLPSLGASGSGTGFEYTFKKTDASGNSVTITPNAGHSDTIDGAATYVLSSQYSAVTIYSGHNNSGGLTWYIKHTVGATGAVPTFVDDEVPTGTIDGVNDTFTLAHSPSPATSLNLFLNGSRLTAGIGYTLSGSTITYASDYIPFTGNTHLTCYRY